MALDSKTNQLTGPAITGNAGTTDPGHQPKLVAIFTGLQTADGSNTDAQFSLGFASSSTTERGGGWSSDHNTASSDVVRYFSTTEIIRLMTAGTTTANVVATLTSLDATGFTPNFGTLTTVSPKYNYWTIGGSDVECETGSVAASTSTGNQTITLANGSLTPSIVMLWITLQTAAGQANNNSQYSFGCFDASLNQWTVGGKAQNAQTTMNTSRFFKNDRCIIVQSTTATTYVWEASAVSVAAGEFTINIDVTDGSAFLIGYAVVGGGQWKVGTDTQKTSTGTKDITGIGFTPTGALFSSVCDTQTAGANDHYRMSFGASTGSSNNTAIFVGDSDATANAVASTIMRANKCIVMGTENGATPTTNAEAAVSAFSSGVITLDWTTADATARVFGYIAYAGNAVAGGDTSNFFKMF